MKNLTLTIIFCIAFIGCIAQSISYQTGLSRYRGNVNTIAISDIKSVGVYMTFQQPYHYNDGTGLKEVGGTFTHHKGISGGINYNLFPESKRYSIYLLSGIGNFSRYTYEDRILIAKDKIFFVEYGFTTLMKMSKYVGLVISLKNNTLNSYTLQGGLQITFK